MTSSTSPIVSGSSALVGSSKSSSAGFIASAPRDRHALLLTTRQLAGIDISLVREADALEQRLGLANGLFLRNLPNVHWSLDHVLERRPVREEVEPLEDEADLGPLPGDRPLRVLHELAVVFPVADQVPAHFDAPGVHPLEVVDAAKEGRLPGAGGTDDAHGLAASDFERDAPQDLQPAEALVHVDREQGRAAGGRPPVVAHLAPRAQAVTGVQAWKRRSRRPRASSSSETASFRSIWDWMRLQTVVSARYQNATAVKYSTGLKVVE
jgi:hypothetical protein